MFSSWCKRHNIRLPWVLAPLARFNSRVRHAIPPLAKDIPPEQINARLETIYKNASRDDSIDPSCHRTLTPFWTSYNTWLTRCKNLEDSQSQIEYWRARGEFLELNKNLTEKFRHTPIPWSMFHPPLPDSVKYLQAMAQDLVTLTLNRMDIKLQLVLLMAQLTLNVVFITRQFVNTINFVPSPIGLNSTENDITIQMPKTREDYIRSATGIGAFVEFAFLCIYLLVGLAQVVIFFSAHSFLNKGLAAENLVIAIQKTATFSLFLFIHLLNPARFVTEFHDPPFLETFTNIVKFNFHKPEWQSRFRRAYKIVYTLICRPVLITLGLLAFYVKLLQVSVALSFFSQLHLGVSAISALFNNPTSVLTFLGLANNVASLYGIPPEDDRKMFFDHVRIHEYDLLHAILLTDRDLVRAEISASRHGDLPIAIKKGHLWSGYWNVVLFAIGIRGKELVKAFWDNVYGGKMDIHESKKIKKEDAWEWLYSVTQTWRRNVRK